jgi:TolA-binding protein
MRRIHAALVVTLAAAALPARAAAADKQHQQLMAEIRMLQEQQQQLQQMLGTLGDTLKALNTRLDDQSAASRKAFADQTLQLNTIGDGVRVLREKVDDTSVRLSSLTQEMDSVRQAVTMAIPPSASSTAPPPGTAPRESAPGATTGQPPATSPNPIPAGVSPQRMFDESQSDYGAGRYELAIQGFQTYIAAFPRSPQAAEAQIYIGRSLSYLNKLPEALAAYQKVVTDYPQQTSSVATAYYTMGQVYERMNQPDQALRAYENARRTDPNSDSAILAKQRIDALNKKD